MASSSSSGEEALVFVKKLTHTDVKYRLSFPSKHVGILPADGVEFGVKCGEQVYTFWCTKRKEGPLKPVIEKGWSSLVRDRGIQVGDMLEFYMQKPLPSDEEHEDEDEDEEEDDGDDQLQQPTRYWIEFIGGNSA
ncbi:AP2/ERF and B3 domain-containing transcription repressor RAV2-like [Senna tora]|uniref:AP2/ERF and B3 domain-containing transcription repressor RAV2-like n=1 Tax=Senna tora TaxID=362788 RepID=A0A834XD69_9FABA|nr:AP2/ERF and B3 domain-containing transcription repressor RAV2-like [Senna tora]